ncbi:hypothetical protein VTK73DRAFT_5367 [Phialemonium thermophilum]|uniref:Uncharacterized protein n=1 Tax=Phialemonium thermophilum TaxID=223376 RepID=A0ABR3Y8G1_9PEZI
MSAPRTKRQFAGAAIDPSQRHITSYFKNVTGAQTFSNNPSDTTDRAPLLPPSVQANLLSVGMRVRKSVPEGYKTGGPYGSLPFCIEADGTAHSTIPSPGAPFSSARMPTPTSPPQSSSRELLPFCGIHRVGGLAVQPESIGGAFPSALVRTDIFDGSPSRFDTPAINEVPSLTSSQDSVETDYHQYPNSPTTAVFFPAANSRKRLFSDEEGDNESGGILLADSSLSSGRPLGTTQNGGEWFDCEVSPRSLTPASWGNTRIIAVPKKRRGTAAKPGGTDTMTNSQLRADPNYNGSTPALLTEMGQENTAMDDFEEAEFLDYQLQAGMDVE